MAGERQGKALTSSTKLALISKATVHNATVAVRLWEVVSVVAGVDLSYEAITLPTSKSARSFLDQFRADPAWKGCNIAPDLQAEMLELVDRREAPDVPYINAMYKDGDEVVGVHTQPVASQKAIEASANLYKCATALVLSTDGSGLPLACHLREVLGLEVSLYDPQLTPDRTPQAVAYVASLAELAAVRYDLIVNTIPADSQFTQVAKTGFYTPIDLDILSDITHESSILQEVNFLPSSTLFLQMGRALGLQTVPGDLMLIFEALEGLRRFCHSTLDENSIAMLLEEMGLYLADLDAEVLAAAISPKS